MTDENSGEERAAMRQCLEEAFWYRSLPSAMLTGSAVYWAIRTGRLKPNPRLGAWPQVAGFSSLAYILGKLSFIVGHRCMDIFLEKAPDSVVSERVRRRRHISEDDGYGYNMANRGLNVTRQRFADILEEFQPEDMSEKEQAILDDCDSVALYQYSLPLAAGSSCGLYAAMQHGLLPVSRRFKRFPRLPKMVAGSCLGYLVGQCLYVYSSDCTDRFQQYDPDGTVARLLRGEHLVSPGAELGKSLQEPLYEPQGYVLPGEETRMLRQNTELEWNQPWTAVRSQ